MQRAKPTCAGPATYVSSGPHAGRWNGYKYEPAASHSLRRRSNEHPHTLSTPLHSPPALQAPGNGDAAGRRRRGGDADAAVQAVRGDDLAAVRVRRDERDHQGVAEPRHEPLRPRGVPPRLRHALHRAIRARPGARQGPPPDDPARLPQHLRARPHGPRHRPELLLRRAQVHLAHLLLRHEQHAPRHDLRHGGHLQDGEGGPQEGPVPGQGGGNPRHRGRRHAHDALQGPRRRDGLVQARPPPRPAPGRRRRRQGLVQGLHLPHHRHPRMVLPLHPPGPDADDVQRAADPDHAHLLRGHPAGHRSHLGHGAHHRRLEDRLRHEPPRRRLRRYRDVEPCLLRSRAGDPEQGPRLRLCLQPADDDRGGHHGLLHPLREHLPRSDHRVRADRGGALLGALGEAQGERGEEGDRGDGDPRYDGQGRRRQRQDHGHRGGGRRAAGEGPGQRQGGHHLGPRRRGSPDAAARRRELIDQWSRRSIGGPILQSFYFRPSIPMMLWWCGGLYLQWW